MYYNQHTKGEKWRQGDSVTWTYVKGVKEGTPDFYTFDGQDIPVKYVAFRDAKELDNFIIDWDKVLSTLVKAKLTRLYESVGWDETAASGYVVPKIYW